MNPPNFSKSQIIIIGIVGLIILFFVLVFFGIIPGLQKNGLNRPKEAELAFWGIEDESVMREMINSYSSANPNAKIRYQQFDETDYEKTLINALAGNKGPDVFMIKNSWLIKHYDKIFPAPETQFLLTQLRQLFPKIIETDFSLRQNSEQATIYALPLHLDTLAFIYNKNFFDRKGIALPPRTWSDFQRIIPKLREFDLSGRLVKTAGAIGGSEKSINKATDLLNLIMLQNGKKMVDEQSLNFYLQFGNPGSIYYTWNNNLRSSLDNFSQETNAAIFNYASAIKIVKSKNPFIDIGVSPMLQFNLENPVNYANYWGLTVSKQSKNPETSWNFIISLTANQQIAEQYLQLSGRPPALRTLIQKYSNDPDIGVFTQQALTAESWLQQDDNEIRNIFSNMIEFILSGKLTPKEALEEAENKINSL
ncbi:MAG: extracellular solute-binding protein [Patescibacteria group bacterium]